MEKIIRWFLVGSMLLIIFWYILHVSQKSSLLRLYVFDTRGAPSFMLITPTNNRILIDGGANSEIIEHITKIIPFYTRTIDALVMTKCEANSVNGLIDVVKRYHINSLYIPGITPVEVGIATTTDTSCNIFLQEVAKRDISVHQLAIGDSISIGAQLRINVLFPEPSTTTFVYSMASAPVLVLQLRYGDTTILLLDDTTPKIEKFIVESNMHKKIPLASLDTTVLVVNHGLQRNLFYEELIQLTHPEYVIYAHKDTHRSPSTKSVLDAFPFIFDYARFNIKQKSTIEVLSDGKTVNVI